MARRKSKSVASESRLFVLALGLLVGFVIAFVFLLSRLPVDSVISQYNNGEITGAEVEEMNFDYYAVLQAQKAARKPEQVIVVEAPAVIIEPATPQPEVQAPTAVPLPVPQPRGEPAVVAPRVQPRVQQPIVQSQPPRQVQSQVLPQPSQPRLEALPQVPSRTGEPAVVRAPVREIMASTSGQDSFYVEAGSYRDNTDALNVQSALFRLGLESFIVVRQDSKGNFGHRVRIGPFLEQSQLDKTRARLRASGIDAKLIRVKG